MKPARHQFTVLQQICDLIPGHLVSKLAREHGVEEQSRTFSPWSHVVSLVFAQVSHALSLNDVCDTLRNHCGVLTTVPTIAHPSVQFLLGTPVGPEHPADATPDMGWTGAADAAAMAHYLPALTLGDDDAAVVLWLWGKQPVPPRHGHEPFLAPDPRATSAQAARAAGEREEQGDLVGAWT